MSAVGLATAEPSMQPMESEGRYTFNQQHRDNLSWWNRTWVPQLIPKGALLEVQLPSDPIHWIPYGEPDCQPSSGWAGTGLKSAVRGTRTAPRGTSGWPCNSKVSAPFPTRTATGSRQTRTNCPACTSPSTNGWTAARPSRSSTTDSCRKPRRLLGRKGFGNNLPAARPDPRGRQSAGLSPGHAAHLRAHACRRRATGLLRRRPATDPTTPTADGHRRAGRAGRTDPARYRGAWLGYGPQIMRSSIPLFIVTVVGEGPVTSKWIFPVDCAPSGIVAPLMLDGEATNHRTR